MADKWEMNVIHLPKSEKFKAVLKIDSIRYIGSEGEPMIGDPRDFNDYNSVLETLRSTSRESYFPSQGKTLLTLGYFFIYPETKRDTVVNKMYLSQTTLLMLQTSRFETQALPPQPSKRRKLNTEESVAWKELKSLSYKDYQITAGDQGFLDAEATWVHPGNIHEYNKRPEDEEPLPAADTSLIENGHPPLDSPEPEPLSQRHDDSQFHTQAPGMLDPTQALGVQTSSEEKEIEWEPTQEETRPARRPTVEEKSEESLEWEASPARPPRVGRMVYHHCDFVNCRMDLLPSIVTMKQVHLCATHHILRSKKRLRLHRQVNNPWKKRSITRKQRRYYSRKISPKRLLLKRMNYRWIKN